VNEEPPPKSYLDLTLMQHHSNENLEPRKVHVRLEVEPPQVWYYRIASNSCTLVMLQVHPAFGDEHEITCNGCYETKDTSIFAWFSIPGIKHYCWLHSPIRQLPSNSKADYLVCTIRHILNFLQL
jgi:hypothetical protein